jgi:hypothetical protein
MASPSTNGKHDAIIEAERAKSMFCFREEIAPGLRMEMELKNIFVSTHSEFQKVEVIETYFGKVSRERASMREQWPLESEELRLLPSNRISHIHFFSFLNLGATDACHRRQDTEHSV